MEIYRVAVWVRCAVLCCAKRLTTTCTWKQTCARANRAVLKPFFLVCDQTKIVSHTTQKVLKIYLKFTAAHQFLHARYFLFWYLMLFTSFSNEKKNPFHSKRNSRWYILGWMCWQKRHGNIQQQQEATNCITQPYFLHIWNSYLHELFSFSAGSCCRFFRGAFFSILNLSFFQGA